MGWPRISMAEKSRAARKPRDATKETPPLPTDASNAGGVDGREAGAGSQAGREAGAGGRDGRKSRAGGSDGRDTSATRLDVRKTY